MKYILKLFGIILVCIVIFGLLLVSANLLNTTLQNNGFFHDLHRNTAPQNETDGFWRWGDLHYIFIWIEILFIALYSIACIVLCIKYYNKYID